MFGIDDAILGAGISAGANLIGGLFTNQANSAQAQANRDFQAQQSGTSYQRAVADMQAAGLSPMLAYSQGGASTPTGATAQMQNPASGAVSAYQESRKVSQDISQSKENVDLMKSQKVKAEAETLAAIESAKLTAQQAAETAQRVLYYPTRFAYEMANLHTQARLNTAQEGRHIIGSKLDATELPGKENIQATDQTFYGRHIRPYLKDLVSGLTSAKVGADIFRGKPPVTVINKGR